ncbi:nitrite reductase [NAD(P)H] small subunit [Tatumella ptyseos ATCC 33301]|uniref:Nitrite reductase (NADH) small subunit n=3 Tax=Erwiniaceae TaxID=1903409 RepID=A0A085J971_9GAMM|nr:nitrite reductase [NAD(P)H] small subunit [Tatumella ptyseos ATCC 33301]SQK72452.1 Nitrite reductase [NAD(P)H] small subunit [Tatumella ptyseos]
MMTEWITVCNVNDILPGTGVCALVENHQVALFRPRDDVQIYAISNIDPFFQASVLSRGIIAEHQGDLWVASPLKKQHFRLRDGLCMEDNRYSVPGYAVRVSEGAVQVSTLPAAIPGGDTVTSV